MSRFVPDYSPLGDFATCPFPKVCTFRFCSAKRWFSMRQTRTKGNDLKQRRSLLSNLSPEET